MLILTYAPDGTTDWAEGIVLCATSRSITELAVEWNHTRVLNIEHLALALGSGAAGFAQDFGNQRNTLSLKVRRDMDFSNTAFADPEAAFLFALDQPGQFPGTGCLRIQVAGVTTRAIRYLLNTGVSAITNKFEDLGVAPVFNYAFNGGLITPTSPF